MIITDIIKSSVLINQPAFARLPIENVHGNNFLALSSLLFATIELRARSGTFTTPYFAPVKENYKLFKLRVTNDNLADLYDSRALEIFNFAKSNGKNICVCWSGGIDSTSMLTSFLKNLSVNDLSIVHVVLTSSSLLENYNFYKNFISGKVKCIHYNSIKLNNEFLDKNILLHGDPADGLFGTVVANYKNFVAGGEHLEPWKKHYKKMGAVLNKKGSMLGPKTSNFGDWFVKKISDNIEEVGESHHISTVVDWWWWAYFNFRWQTETEKLLYFMRLPSRCFDPISESNLKIFREYNFYGTEKFQLWSYSNLKNISTKQHKSYPKKYICDFTKDEIFLKNKKKVGILGPNGKEWQHRKIRINIPFFFDKHHQGHNQDHNIKHILKMLLEKYKG